MIGVAAGLAAAGKIAFCSSFAVFAPGHCFDQLRMAVAQPGTNVKLVASHGGVVTGEDGASAEALEDITLDARDAPVQGHLPGRLRRSRAGDRSRGPHRRPLLHPHAPPKDADHLRRLATASSSANGPVLRPGKDVTLIAVGELVASAARGGRNAVRRGHRRPRPQRRLASADGRGALCSPPRPRPAPSSPPKTTSSLGGLGSLVAYTLAEKHPTPVAYVGMRDRYGTSGTWEQLLEHFGLTPAAIAQAARDVIARKL